MSASMTMPTSTTGRRAARALAVTAAMLAAPLMAAGAQGSVPGAIARRAAQNAVAATDAHTAAMTSPTAGGPATPATRPATQKPQPASAARTTAARPAAAAMPAATKAAPATKAVAATTPPKGGSGTAPATNAAGAPAYAARSKEGTPAGGGPQTTTVSVTERGPEGTLTFQRETFEYTGRGRRDPFVSLIKSGEIRPLFADLKLVTVLYDPTGRNSVAIMHDVSTKDQYRVKVGQTLGRMRVSQIQPKQVVFAIEEFGYGRQAVLALNDSTRARKQ